MTEHSFSIINVFVTIRCVKVLTRVSYNNVVNVTSFLLMPMLLLLLNGICFLMGES